jgi:hypothetical protein
VARCSAAGVGVTNLPTTARGPNLYCSADGGLRLREVGVFNTTANAVSVGLGVATALGTVAGAATEFCEDDPGHTVLGIVNTSHSADATIAAVARRTTLGAAIGSGVIWTFGENGLYRPEGTGNGVVITCPTGTAQFLDFYFVWDE